MMDKAVDSRNMETQTEELESNKTSKGTQTECATMMTTTSETQTELETEIKKRSIGIGCNIVPQKKVKYVQATVGVVCQGSLATVATEDASTQRGRNERRKYQNVGVWCNQSPGAMGRHTQTVGVSLRNITTNTERIRTKEIGTKTEEVGSDVGNPRDGPSHIEWGDTMDRLVKSEKMDSDTGLLGWSWKGSGASNREEYIASDSQNAAHHTTGMGRSGLSNLLASLEICSSSMEQYSQNASKEKRNNKIKKLIQCTDVGEKNLCGNSYWAILDDLSVQIYETNGTFEMGRYVKMYGDFVSLMSSNDDNSVEYKNVEKRDPLFNKCKNFIESGIKPIIQRIRSRESIWNSGGYGGGYGGRSGGNASYGGYRRDYRKDYDYGSGDGNSWQY
jgi:hypothetical protein